MRIFRFRVLKFKPRIVTSYRPHGKWGDLIVCLLPVSWCINIITNSNFILRMIEWQSESSLFTLRVRGKQWYWVYKYELKILTDILTTPKNLGNNKWVISNPLDLQVADDYLHIHQLRAQDKWIKNYWGEYLDKEIKDLTNFSATNAPLVKFDFLRNFSKNNLATNMVSNALVSTIDEQLDDLPKNNHKNMNRVNDFVNANNTLNNIGSFEPDARADLKFFKNNFKGKQFFFDEEAILSEPIQYTFTKKFLTNVISKPKNNFDGYVYGHSEAHESFRWAKKGQNVITPLRIIKYPLNLFKGLGDSEKFEMFRLRFNVEKKHVEQKINPHQTQWIFKQKRYKRLGSIKTKTRFYTDEHGNMTKNIRFTYQPNVYKNRIITNDDKNYYTNYQLFKKTKKRNEDIKLPFNKRLLRTKRIVVLPAHVNLTVITNSFDVVHSWFIPGLGLKMDCIPGRSTHHVLHIDHAGFYYGQCAEICGRYHHHMPIRICALPFEHFLVWWHAFGLPKLLYSSDPKKNKYLYASRKYVW
jgi:heme/copper-type cytochrome/quinol oxidase subunit 2